MRTDAVHGDAADDHHVLARVGETLAECSCWVEVVTAEQTFLPEFPHALRGFSHMGRLGFDAAGAQEIADSAFEGCGVEGVALRNADSGWRQGRGEIAVTVSRVVSRVVGRIFGRIGHGVGLDARLEDIIHA